MEDALTAGAKAVYGYVRAEERLAAEPKPAVLAEKAVYLDPYDDGLNAARGIMRALAVFVPLWILAIRLMLG